MPAPIVAAADADDVRQVELRVAQLGGDHAAEVRVLDRARSGRSRCGAGRSPAGGCLPCWSSTGSGRCRSSPWRSASQPWAIWMPGTAVSIALVVAAVGVAGLGVEGLELARPARHPEQDAGHLPLAQLVGLDRHQVGEAHRRRAPPRPGRSPGGTRGGRARPGRSSPP